MSPLALLAAGGVAMFGMCCVSKHAPFWLAVPVNLFIWYATAALCGALP